jgi:hypothetical protein
MIAGKPTKLTVLGLELEIFRVFLRVFARKLGARRGLEPPRLAALVPELGANPAFLPIRSYPLARSIPHRPRQGDTVLKSLSRFQS